jgi:hypothetical protein
MKVSEVFPSKFLKLEDVTQPMSVTITAVEMDATYEKPVVHFAEIEQALSLNRTNTRTLGADLGDEMNDWVGRRIIIYAGQLPFNGRMQPGLQVRVAKNTGGANSSDTVYARAKGRTPGAGVKPPIGTILDDDIPM